MAQVIYINQGCRVEIQGTIVVRMPDGRIADRYQAHEVQAAIETADEIASLLQAA